jgi:type II restriction/modification system DNA methylase subunit YeeA
MDYYIAPQEPVTDFLRIARPEDIKLCDPACGSGHMLTYAFDLLYAIYEEEGADPVEIPEKILTHNLYGIEIDERAAELAAFALTMKARGKQRRFLNKRIQPNICVLRPINIAPQDLDAYVLEVGGNLFTANLRTLLTQFEEADNFGSLIRPVAMDYAEIRRILAEKGIGNQLLLEHVHHDVLRVLKQAEYLSQRYQVVVANPPYMGSKGMNGRLSAWAKDNYPDSKADLFAMFIERNLDLVAKHGAVGMITMQSWMFLSSYEKLRANLLNNKTLTAMAHLGPRAFDSIGGEVVSTTAFMFENAPHREMKGDFLRLVDGSSEAEKDRMIREAIHNRGCGWYHRAAGADFQRIPGQPIAYWVSESIITAFERGRLLSSIGKPVVGLQTGENARFVRTWQEISLSNLGLGCNSRAKAEASEKKWFPYNKGGDFCRWYGNQEFVVNWFRDGDEIKNFTDSRGELRSRPQNLSHYFCRSISWSKISSSLPAFRYFPEGFIFDVAGTSIFPNDQSLFLSTLGYCNSKVTTEILKALSPTLNFEVGHIGSLPILFDGDERSSEHINRLIDIAKADWDSLETSWDFKTHVLLKSGSIQTTLITAYEQCRSKWRDLVDEMNRLEEENNRNFIEAYGLQGELTPDVPLSEITLTCNPHYRYGGNKSEQELEDLLCADTMRDFISYSVGCMFGRYSLDQPGLILANQGETPEDYLRQVSQPRFTPDADNVIPLLDGDWFSDDITGRFREFLRVTFGDEHYDENLRFIESALGKKGKPLPIRDFFLKDFYTDHVKRYKKRPIYWLFSSPKGSFNALIYLHRYRPDTASVVLQYLRDFRSKLVSERDHQEQMSISTSASQGEKTKALKRIEELKKILVELDYYERDTLYPLATRQVVLDLDDGVKVNYLKLDVALKKIPGLEAKEED